MVFYLRTLQCLVFFVSLSSCALAEKQSSINSINFRVNFSVMSQFGIADEFTILSGGELFYAKPEDNKISDDYVTASTVSLENLMTMISNVPDDIPSNVEMRILTTCQDGNYLRVIMQKGENDVLVLKIPMSESCFSRSEMANWIEGFLFLYEELSPQLK